MESRNIFTELKNSINQLETLNTTLLVKNKENIKEIEKKETIVRIVEYFHEILSDKYIQNGEKKENSQDNKNKKYYWDFISKHFNTPVSRFLRTFENNENDEINNNWKDQEHKKGKTWIYFSILERTFCDSIKLIYKEELDLKFYDKDSMLRKDKNEILNILGKLEKIQIKNIFNKDYNQYLDYLKKDNKNQINEEESCELSLNDKELMN